MALTKFTKDMQVIQSLDDEPNDVGGLTAAELKSKYDEAGKAIQQYINETLTVEIDANKVDKSELQDIVLGQIPDGTITKTKLSSEVQASVDKADGSVQQSDKATTEEATAGVNDEKYMTPAKTAGAITAKKATTEEAIAGTDDLKLMTPAKTTAVAKKYSWQLGDIRSSALSSLSNRWLRCDGTIADGVSYSNLSDALTKGWNTNPSVYGPNGADTQRGRVRVINGYTAICCAVAQLFYFKPSIGTHTFSMKTISGFYPTDIDFIGGKWVIVGVNTSSYPTIAVSDTIDGTYSVIQIASSSYGNSLQIVHNSNYIVIAAGKYVMYASPSNYTSQAAWTSYEIIPTGSAGGAVTPASCNQLSVYSDNFFWVGAFTATGPVYGCGFIAKTITPTSSGNWAYFTAVATAHDAMNLIKDSTHTSDYLYYLQRMGDSSAYLYRYNHLTKACSPVCSIPFRAEVIIEDKTGFTVLGATSTTTKTISAMHFLPDGSTDGSITSLVPDITPNYVNNQPGTLQYYNSDGVVPDDFVTGFWDTNTRIAKITVFPFGFYGPQLPMITYTGAYAYVYAGEEE